jgi:glycyl-tRNA synthetase
MGEIEHFVDPLDKSHPRFASVAGEVLTLFTAENQVGSGKTVDMTAGEASATKVVNNETLTYFMTRTQQFLLKAGVNRAGLRFRQHLPSERAHYGASCGCDCDAAACVAIHADVVPTCVCLQPRTAGTRKS